MTVPSAARAQPAVVVLQSFSGPRPSTNPYLVQLRDAIDALPDAAVLTFSWRRALLGRYDVFHVHWPEHMLTRSTPLKRLAARGAAALFLARLRLARIPVVRTVHNLEAHEAMPGWQRRWIAHLDRITAVRIRLTDLTPVDAATQVVTIPHGHYRDWYARFPGAEVERGTIGYVGLIKPYKGVEQLIAAFGSVPADHRLLVGGRPSTAALAEELRELAAPDPRVQLQLGYLSDPELVTLVTASELVVLPYRQMHNSGSALAALSLDRPVLVPANEVNRLLADEVGAGWVQFFEGEITADDLVTALRAAHELLGSGARPDLSAREWADAGRRHLAAYRLAIAGNGAGRRYSP